MTPVPIQNKVAIIVGSIAVRDEYSTISKLIVKGMLTEICSAALLMTETLKGNRAKKYNPEDTNFFMKEHLSSCNPEQAKTVLALTLLVSERLTGKLDIFGIKEALGIEVKHSVFSQNTELVDFIDSYKSSKKSPEIGS